VAYLEDCARRYGENFTVRLPTFPAPITFISDPDAIKEIFAADGTDLIEAGALAAPVMARVIGEHAMLIIDGAEHRRHRGLIMPYFMRGQFSKFGATILTLAERAMATWP
jgi:cytochrome P450